MSGSQMIPQSVRVNPKAPNWREIIRRPSTIVVALLIAVTMGGAFYIGQTRVANPNITPIDLLVSKAASQINSVNGVNKVTDQFLDQGNGTGYLTADLDPSLSPQAQLSAANSISNALADWSKGGMTVNAEMRIGNAMIGISPNPAENASRVGIADALTAIPDVSALSIALTDDSTVPITVSSTTSSDPLVLLDDVHQTVSDITTDAVITANVVPSAGIIPKSLYGNEPTGIPWTVQGVKSVTYPTSTTINPTFRAQAELLENSPDTRGYQLETYSENTSLDVAVPTRADESAVRNLFATGLTTLPDSSIRFEYLDSL